MASASISASENDPENCDTDGRKSKGGAPVGSHNALRHGLYCARPSAWVSEYGNRQINIFRRALAKLVAENCGGEISLLASALIQSASEAARCAVANRELLAGAGTIDVETRMALDREYIKFLDARDRKLKELGIGLHDMSEAASDPPDPLAAIPTVDAMQAAAGGSGDGSNAHASDPPAPEVS